MTELLNDHLFTWSGTPGSGVLTKHASIAYFIGRDNGFNKGDLRSAADNGPTPWNDDPDHNRKNGDIDVGAYEN
jgi:hypothetical protein